MFKQYPKLTPINDARKKNSSLMVAKPSPGTIAHLRDKEAIKPSSRFICSGIANDVYKHPQLCSLSVNRSKIVARGIPYNLQNEDDIPVDTLLSQWADSIAKAEDQFEVEELAFARAQERIRRKDPKQKLRALLHVNPTTKVPDKATKSTRNSNSKFKPSMNDGKCEKEPSVGFT